MATVIDGPPIRVASWWDSYHFTDEGQVECPDCEEQSPVYEELYSLVAWVDRHQAACPA